MSGDMDYNDMAETHNGVTTKKKKKWWIALIVVGVLLIVVFPEFCGSGSMSKKGHEIPVDTLKEALLMSYYKYNSFNLPLYRIIAKGIATDANGYKAVFYHGDEIPNNILELSPEFLEKYGADYIYVACVSGYVKDNPYIDYLTHYSEVAIVGLLVFDHDDNVVKSDIRIVDRSLEIACAVVLSEMY